jgi:hypothetical protein
MELTADRNIYNVNDENSIELESLGLLNAEDDYYDSITSDNENAFDGYPERNDTFTSVNREPERTYSNFDENYRTNVEEAIETLSSASVRFFAIIKS